MKYGIYSKHLSGGEDSLQSKTFESKKEAEAYLKDYETRLKDKGGVGAALLLNFSRKVIELNY